MKIFLPFLFLYLSGCQFTSKENLMVNDLKAEPQIGKRLLSAYGCGSCHEIKDVPGNPGMIGPPLTNWKKRKYIAGMWPNRRAQLVKWIMNPQQMDPGNAMPDLGVGAAEAIDMAAYLETQ